jgi:hypothetical protein
MILVIGIDNMEDKYLHHSFNFTCPVEEVCDLPICLGQNCTEYKTVPNNPIEN